MSKVMADPKLRATFVSSSVDFIIKHNFDAFDLDWEYPGKQGAGYNVVDPVNDSKNVETFFRELRAELTKKSPNKYIEIHVATGANKLVIDQYKNCANLIDNLGMMTYDFYGGWDCNTLGHLSGLYPNPLQKGAIEGFNVHDAVTHARKYFPAEKVSIGCPFYARGWEGARKDPNNPNAPIIFGNATSAGVTLSQGKGGEPGLTCWKELAPKIQSKEYTEYWDDVSKVPYCMKGAQLWSYDNVRSASEKAKYVIDNNLSGIILWQLSDDVKGNDSLLTALHNTFTTYKK
jgi:chitinase